MPTPSPTLALCLIAVKGDRHEHSGPRITLRMPHPWARYRLRAQAVIATAFANGLAAAKLVDVEPGERMLIPCVGGRDYSRLVRFPPPLELEEGDGLYVLVDEGPPHEWRYQFVPSKG